MKELTIQNNIVTIDGESIEITKSLPSNIEAVQYHLKSGRCLEEPLMVEVSLNKYQEFIDEYNSIKNKVQTPEEIEQANIEMEISNAKQHLKDTDWVVIKINEAQVLGNDIQPLLEKYTVELAKRLEARALINSLEG